MAKYSDFIKIFLVGILFFILVFPLSNQINFKHVDDFIYYKQVKSFSKGNYDLNSYIEATFYVQGFLGAFFTKFLPSEKLPILTLIVSTLGFVVFTALLYKFYFQKLKESLLVSVLFFAGPITVMSMLGFMTENYFLLFLILALFCFEGFTKTPHKIYFVFFNIFIILGFFVRQLGLVPMLAFVVYLILQKKFKWAFLQTIITSGLLFYYFNYFNLTDTMQYNHGLRISNLLNIVRTFNLSQSFIYYSVLFILPLIAALVSKHKKILALSVIAFILLLLFKSGEMFPLRGVVNSRGFFTGGILGLKYEILHSAIIFGIWQKLGIVAIFSSALILLSKFKKLVNFYTIYFIIHLGLMLVMIDVYDRYAQPLILCAILILLSLFPQLKFSKIQTVIVGGGLILMLYFSYNYAMDFVLLNRKMWDYASEFSTKQHVPKNEILAGYGWERVYYNGSDNHKYKFNFQTRQSDSDLSQNYSLLDSLYIDYPFNFFKDSKVYFYNKRR